MKCRATGLDVINILCNCFFNVWEQEKHHINSLYDSSQSLCCKMFEIIIFWSHVLTYQTCKLYESSPTPAFIEGNSKLDLTVLGWISSSFKNSARWRCCWNSTITHEKSCQQKYFNQRRSRSSEVVGGTSQLIHERQFT